MIKNDCCIGDHLKITDFPIQLRSDKSVMAVLGALEEYPVLTATSAPLSDKAGRNRHRVQSLADSGDA